MAEIDVIQKQDLDELIKEFYELKDKIRDIHSSKKKNGRVPAEICRKNQLMFDIKQALRRVDREERSRIKVKLWKELGVVI